MTRARQGISERAVDFLEANGYLNSVRAEMKAEVMKSLVELEEEGQIPPSLRISRYTPPDDLNKQAIAFVLEFLKFHKLNNSVESLVREVNWDKIDEITNEGAVSLLAQKIGESATEDGD
jgi:hypothetical protein